MRAWVERREFKLKEEWKLDLWPLGMGATTVAGHATANIHASPQLAPFLPKIFEVPDSCAEHFLVEDIRVGKNSQFLNSSPVSATSFKARDISDIFANLSCDVVHQMMYFTVSVRNMSAEPQVFTACVWGQLFENEIVLLKPRELIKDE